VAKPQIQAVREAALAADLYRRVQRPRGREIDLTVAACAITYGARLWTLNSRDFADIPGLEINTPRRHGEARGSLVDRPLWRGLASGAPVAGSPCSGFRPGQPTHGNKHDGDQCQRGKLKGAEE
jgi:hypothetical protein